MVAWALETGSRRKLEHMGEALIVSPRATVRWTPCVLGSERTFSYNTHSTLARWILVCMAVLDQTRAEPQVRQETCDVLYREWHPPNDCIV
jgi:hypothetical protein